MNLLLLIWLAQDTAQDTTIGTAQLSQQAAAAMRGGDFRTAETSYRQLIAREPANLAWRMNLGLTLHSAARFAEAIPEFRAYLRSQRTPGPIHYLLGLSHLKLAQSCEAVGPLESALRWNRAKARIDLADALAGCRKFAAAAPLYAEASRLQPLDSGLARQAAHCFWEARLYAEALPLFSSSAAAFGQDALFQFEYGDSLARAQGAAAGLPYLRKAVALDSRLLSAQGELGKALVALGENAEAIEPLRLAAAAIPELLLPLARAHRALGQLAEAAQIEEQYKKRMAGER